MEFYVADLTRVISGIVNSAKGETPDWARLELKAEDLRVLALKAQVAHGFERAAQGGKSETKKGKIEG